MCLLESDDLKRAPKPGLSSFETFHFDLCNLCCRDRNLGGWPPDGDKRRAAKALGVSETDVVATLEKGDLKGKKIGTTWRVTKTALDEFLKS